MNSYVCWEGEGFVLRPFAAGEMRKEGRRKDGRTRSGVRCVGKEVRRRQQQHRAFITDPVVGCKFRNAKLE